MHTLNPKSILLALLAGFMVFSCATSPEAGKEELVHYEAEDAVIEGNIVINVAPDNPDKDGSIAEASGDFLYMQDSGSITWTLEMESAGDYLVKIYYAIPFSYGDKKNHVAVNGTALGEQPFAATGGIWAEKLIPCTLNAGTNTISVSHSWGYTWFDYLTVESMEF